MNKTKVICKGLRFTIILLISNTYGIFQVEENVGSEDEMSSSPKKKRNVIQSDDDEENSEEERPAKKKRPAESESEVDEDEVTMIPIFITSCC